MCWFHNGGVTLTDNTEDKASIFDGNWHVVGIAREGDRFDLLRDGQVVATGNSTGAISQTQYWMIGRMRRYDGDFDGQISDVRIYNYPVTDIPDLNNDNMVNLEDFAVLASRYLESKCDACSGADLDFDGDVDINDLTLFSQFWIN